MSNVQNLAQNEAIKKLQDLTEDAPIAMLCTNLSNIPFSTCPMATQKVDDAGTIWFLTGADGQHTLDIQADPRVQLIYSNTGDYAYLTVYGTGEIMRDQAKIDELWNPLAKVWFQGGKDDPNLRVLKASPQDGFYWDTKNNKTVSFLKMIASLATGKTMDDGVQGSLTMEAPADPQSVKAKMPTLKQTVKSMKGKTHEHDDDLLHGSHSPLDAVTDPAVNIIKSADFA